jgi:signal transduction histidine kinase
MTNPPPIDAEKAHEAGDLEALREEVREKNTAAVRVAALLVAVINPCFGILDRILIPEQASKLLFIRVGLEALSVGVLALLWRARWLVKRHVIIIGLGMMTIVNWSIEVMIFLHEGYSSPYYAGICLVTITTGYLFLVTGRIALVFHALAYGPFIAPAILGISAIRNVPLFLTHQLFLLSTILIVYVSQRFRYALEEREFRGNLRLQRTQLSLENALGSLKKMDQLKSDFFNNVTHELRTPLTMILAPIESMRIGELGALTKGQIDLIEGVWKNGIRLLKLINDLLDLARMSEQFLYLQVTRTSLREMISAMIEHARPLASRKRITLEFDVETEPENLHCDVQKIERVVVNLLSNALKFTEPGGRVSLRLGTRGSTAFVEVRDTGIGIPSDKLGSIFERFTQADASVTRRYGGTGIGLAFAQSIVRLHGGKIDVQSDVGGGSSFTVLLPMGLDHFEPKLLDRRRRREDGDAQRRREEDRGPREWTARLTDLEEYRFLNIEEATDRRRVRRAQQNRATSVLVVEDNLDVADFLNVQLQEEHTVFVASNGKEGLKLALERRPDAIVTDFMMPEMDGLTMLTRLRADERTSDIPVIMLTAKAQLTDRLDARDAGADVYLSKPFSPKELRSAVNQQISRRGHQAGKLMRANIQSLEIISAGLSHEINNPLNYIRGASAVLNDAVVGMAKQLEDRGADRDGVKTMTERARRMCDTIGIGVRKIERVVDLMRRYAQEGYTHVALPLKVDDAVQNAAQVILPRGEKTVNVEVNLGAPECEVTVVAEELHQAVSSIIQNAVDAVGEAGRVVITTFADETNWILEVTDDGPGIPPDARERIFTPFYTTKAPGEGLGLGLAITQRVVRDANGKLEVDSVPGGGATFRVRLPLVRPRQTDREALTSRTSASGSISN